MVDTNKYITKEGLEKLKEELNHLKTVGRQELSKKLAEAIEMGDLRENAAYHDAKERQAFMEGKIMELEDIISNAVIIDDDKKDKKTVMLGTRITVKWDSQQREFRIVGSNEANPADGRISNQSPLGKAFLGKKKNDVVEVQVPKGVIKYKIIKIE